MLNGFLNLKKDKGMTSQKAVLELKKILKEKGIFVDKIGHLGTLDPDGMGVLPIALNKATTLFDYFLDKKKTYYTEFVFGMTSDTLDASGKILSEEAVDIKESDILSIIPALIGKIDQIPPNYSAKSVGGVRAYKLARAGEEVSLKPKTVDIYSITLIKKLDKNVFSFMIECGGGTYIRSICRDMAALLNTVGLMRLIKRTKSGCFDIEESLSLEEFKKGDLSDKIISLESVSEMFKRYEIEKNKLDLVLNGVQIDAFDMEDGLYVVYCGKLLVGIGTKTEDGKLKLKTRLYFPKKVLALGYFDSIHKGHVAIINAAKEMAKKYDAEVNVITFDENYLKIIKKAPAIYQIEERKQIFKALGIDKVIVLKTDEKFYKMSGLKFLDRIIDKNVVGVVCGEDYRFGCDGKNADDLQAFCEKFGINIAILSILTDNGIKISSSEIRKALDDGDILRANSMLPNPFSLCGVVVKGQGRGATLGFPTANIDIDKLPIKQIPKQGVYKTIAEFDKSTYHSITNVGTQPTFKGEIPTIETHLFGFDGDLYGKCIKVSFLKRIREVKKFDSINDLVEQIKKDIKDAKND